ncbi:hypothetical protein UFOVP635_20 [uncultured Caudovirales phage]|uniref:Uncharacterized protein n=1 Tax=uncultured Caudovirales phage TaxID=2100421 RepID=A0A6J5N5K8_9CAUD|nr:hypothetical protein UFOVP635_20 [uncultured Caudovirales phage]
MSFLSGITNFFTSNSIVSSIVKVVGLGLVVNAVSKSVNKGNNTGNDTANIDAGVRLQIPPAAENKIPVLYGTAFFGGIITDAVMTNTNKTMYYCLTLSEKTGNKLSNGQPSDYVFKDVYWNKGRIVFQPDGITASYTVDPSGNVDRSIANQVKVYCYKGNSATPATIQNYTATNTTKAYDIVPGWTSSTHVMSDLLFAVVKVDYNRDMNITGIGDMLFEVQNSMYLPGDCLYDYMTNVRYGAAIDPADINSQ